MSSHLDQIATLRKQLLDLGYHEFQLDNIARETVDTTHIENLTEEQSLELVDAFEQYVRFALKCRTKRQWKK